MHYQHFCYLFLWNYCTTVYCFFFLHRIEGQERQGGRPPMFTEQQEREIVNMVLANNAITLNQLQTNIVNNHASFNDIHQVSTSTLARILKKKHIQMKQIYRVPFERNSERVKDCGMIMQRYVFTLAVWSCILSHNLLLYCNMYTRSTLNYTILPDTVLQGVLRMDGEEIQHELIYVDEAGFNLTRTRRRGRNIIGHRAIVNVPGQRGGNITLCAAITQNGVLHVGPYNTALILTFLDQLHNITAANQIDHMQYIVVWDNVSFHRSALVQNWFQQHPHFTVLYLPPYSPFLNPFFPRCLANDNIACDVDEILWPDPARRRDNV